MDLQKLDIFQRKFIHYSRDKVRQSESKGLSRLPNTQKTLVSKLTTYRSNIR